MPFAIKMAAQGDISLSLSLSLLPFHPQDRNGTSRLSSRRLQQQQGHINKSPKSIVSLSAMNATIRTYNSPSLSPSSSSAPKPPNGNGSGAETDGKRNLYNSGEGELHVTLIMAVAEYSYGRKRRLFCRSGWLGDTDVPTHLFI